MILLYPKTTFALVGRKKAAFMGQTCIKNVGYQLKNGMIKEVILK
ncbi:hypothetical protein ACTNEF_08960 [Bariatricus sp. HCP28S3_E4]|nr:hypothetical protein [Bariatricus sp.]